MAKDFDLEKELDEYVCPDMFKAGLKHYIKSNNLKISSKKDFEKVIKDYGELKIGGI